MDTNKRKDVGEWVDGRMSVLAPEDNWQADAAAGLARFHECRRANNWTGTAFYKGESQEKYLPGD
jgi:hypothetical protein